MQIVYVDSDAALHKTVQILAEEKTYLAIDTEFRREDTYFPELCLIQVATIDTVFLIDSLSGINLDPFFDILRNPALLKVLHSGRQDLEIFCHLMKGDTTTFVFDTQIAAMLAGYGESAGFESLVFKTLGVSLDKSLRHTNWMQRPLTENQKTYAINDVLYLRPLYDTLVAKLVLNKRLEWMKEETAALETAEFLIPLPSEAWNRLSTKPTSRRYLALVQQLAEWREDTAQRSNTPRSWLLKDEVILDIASRSSNAQIDLNKIPKFPKDDPLIFNEVSAIVAHTMQMSETLLPLTPALPTLSSLQQNIMEMLKLLLKLIAHQENLNPKLIAEKEDLIRWITLDPEHREQIAGSGWRHKLFWQKADALLEGKITLHVHKGRIIIDES